MTSGFDLPAKWIFHAVGPVWQGGGYNEDLLLASCYQQSMALAADKHCHSIAFPAISCGVYGFPLERAVPIAIGAVREAIDKGPPVEKVIFCCFDAQAHSLYSRALDAF